MLFRSSRLVRLSPTKIVDKNTPNGVIQSIPFLANRAIRSSGALLRPAYHHAGVPPAQPRRSAPSAGQIRVERCTKLSLSAREFWPTPMRSELLPTSSARPRAVVDHTSCGLAHNGQKRCTFSPICFDRLTTERCHHFRLAAVQSKGTNGKPPTRATRMNFRKLIPTTVAFDMSCRSF